MATVTYSTAPKTIRYGTDGRKVEATLLSSVESNIMLFSALVDGTQATTRQPATYRQLQQACKLYGVKASGKCETLRRHLHEAMTRAQRGGVVAPMPTTKRQRKAASTVAPSVAAAPVETTVDDLETIYAMDCANCYECPDCEPVEVATPAPKQAAKVEAKTPATTRRESRYPGLTYRTAQQFCKWYREEERISLPNKNAGWDNIIGNIEHILNSERFWLLANGNKRFAAKLNEFGVL